MWTIRALNPYRIVNLSYIVSGTAQFRFRPHGMGYNVQRTVANPRVLVCVFLVASLPSLALQPARPSSVQELAGPTASNPAAACWQVVAYGSDNEPKNYASSFAVDAHMLATNAHVVEVFADVIRKGGYVRAFQADTGEEREVVSMWSHPGYERVEDTVGPDVGLMSVYDSLSSILRLADDRTLNATSVATELHLHGFPGDVTAALEYDDLRFRMLRPRATYLIGRVTAVRQAIGSRASDANGGWLIQHDMIVTGGTSGSPILNAEGAVVAINMGRTSDDHGQNGFAIRSDLLDGLLEMVLLGALPSVDTSSQQNIVNDEEAASEPAMMRLLDNTAEAVGGWPIASILCIGFISLTFLQIARIRAKPQKRLTEAMNRFVDALGHTTASAETENSACLNGESTDAKPR